MKIAALVHTHGKIPETLDTIESIAYNMTNDIVLLVDGASWNHYEKLNNKIPILKGFYHGNPRSPYRNVFLGLINTFKKFPDSDWICYMEYDVLIGSAEFLSDLKNAEKENVWLIGADYRDKQNLGKNAVKLTYLEHIIKDKFQEVHYLLGCVLFYHKKFLLKLMEDDFLEKMLYYTNDFSQGFFPCYTNTSSAAWDILEHMMPTLVKYWGGNIKQLSKWNDKKLLWMDNNYKKYPIRWYPDIFDENEYKNASIMHPLKDYNHPARIFHRKKR